MNKNTNTILRFDKSTLACKHIIYSSLVQHSKSLLSVRNIKGKNKWKMFNKAKCEENMHDYISDL